MLKGAGHRNPGSKGRNKVSRFSARVQYACVAALELALHYRSGQRLQVKTISLRHQIPQGFLVQILRELKKAGIVHSTRGSSGGYILAHPPERISVWDIIQAVRSHDLQARPPIAQSPLAPVFQGLWDQLDEQERQFLQQTTLAQLIQRLPSQLQPMYYI